jgi:hypothetical protein
MLAQAAVLLAALTPVAVHDSRERFSLSAVTGPAPAAYGHAVPAREGGWWLQYWLFYEYQDQDRGVLRSGRHEGDWELVQYRVTDGGRPLEAVYAQHSGAERCGFVGLRAGRPVVYVAHGSHASYLRPGTRDRLWPDPNDEADGRGTVVKPRLVRVGERSPAWMRRAAPWGDSRARWWVPMEQDSPRGPVFQPDRWDPEAFAAGAGRCRAGCDAAGECDGRETALTGAALLALAFALYRFLVRGRRAQAAADCASG